MTTSRKVQGSTGYFGLDIDRKVATSAGTAVASLDKRLLM